jgi:phosphate transport system substrate-binding protein
MSFRTLGSTLLLAALAAVAACGDTPAPSTSPTEDLAPFAGLEGTIDIAGGTAHIPVMEEAAQRIMKAFPAIRITVGGGGSGVGVQKVGEGLVDIGNAGRALKTAEAEKYPDLESHAFAIDGVAVVVHPSNPVKALTTEQARRIFAGEITSWSELGGPDRSVNLYSRDEASGTREVFWKKLLAKGPIAKAANIVTSNGAMKTALRSDEAGIGYMSIGHIDAAVQGVAIDGTEPTQENAKSGAYKVARKLYMNTKGEPSSLVAAFIAYVRSPEGATITSAAGYIPTR